jgi:hypothetical protein
MSNDRKQERHHNNMLNEMKRKAKKIAETFTSLNEKTQGKISHSVASTLVKSSGVTAESTPQNLRRYCIFVSSLLSAAKHDPTNMATNRIRGNIMNNLPKDIADAFKEGKTKEQIVDFYWGVQEFQELWAKLGYQKQDLVDIVKE